MIWHLVAVLILGLCMGALAYALRRLSRNRLPKWWIPVFASVGMMGYLAFYDYTWYDFKRGQLPEGAVVIRESRDSAFFRPWSYFYPSVSAFTIVDGKYAASTQDQQRLVEYFEYTFRKDPVEGLDTQSYVLNCARRERVAFDRARGSLSGAVETVAEDHPVYRQACR